MKKKKEVVAFEMFYDRLREIQFSTFLRDLCHMATRSTILHAVLYN